MLFLPVGDGPTVGGERAAAIVRTLCPRLVVPMHYRTHAVNFLDPPDAFLEALGARVETLVESDFVAEELLGAAGDPAVVLPAAPYRPVCARSSSAVRSASGSASRRPSGIGSPLSTESP